MVNCNLKKVSLRQGEKMLSQIKDAWKRYSVRNYYVAPIPPSRPMAGWKDTPINQAGAAFNEPLVPLGIFTEDYPHTYCPEIFSDRIYYGERDTSPYKVGELDGALLTSFVREGVAKRL